MSPLSLFALSCSFGYGCSLIFVLVIFDWDNKHSNKQKRNIAKESQDSVVRFIHFSSKYTSHFFVFFDQSGKNLKGPVVWWLMAICTEKAINQMILMQSLQAEQLDV